jgi:TPR repeat protein
MRACEKGVLGEAGCARLGDMYAKGDRVWRSAHVAAMFHERACAGGEAASCAKLAALSAQIGAPPRVAGAAPVARGPGAGAGLPPAGSSGIQPAGSSGDHAAPPGGCELPAPGTAGQGIELSEPVKALESRCDAGDGVACGAVAERMSVGNGAPLDPVGAARLFELGCERHDAASCKASGRASERGLGVPRDLPRAIVQYQRACLGAYVPGCAALGELSLSGVAGAPPVMIGIGHLQRSCDRAHAPACRTLAAALHEGRLVPPNATVAAGLLTRAGDILEPMCAKGAGEACLELGLLKEFPAPPVGDPAGGARATGPAELAAAQAAYGRACDAGLPAGCARLVSFLVASGNTSDAVLAEGKLASSCEGGDAAACFAWLSLPGRSGPTPPEALQSACAANMGEGCRRLAEAAAVDRSRGEPAVFLEKACKLGSAPACATLLGSPGSAPTAASMALRRAACGRGDGEQCAVLAQLHLDGGAKDLPCVRALLERSCAEGAAPRSAKGCRKAAELARAGIGGPRDDAAAARLEQAACAVPGPQGAPPLEGCASPPPSASASNSAAPPGASGSSAPSASPAPPPPSAPSARAAPSAAPADAGNGAQVAPAVSGQPVPPLPALPEEPPRLGCSVSAASARHGDGEPRTGALAGVVLSALLGLARRTRRRR